MFLLARHDAGSNDRWSDDAPPPRCRAAATTFGCSPLAKRRCCCCGRRMYRSLLSETPVDSLIYSGGLSPSPPASPPSGFCSALQLAIIALRSSSAEKGMRGAQREGQHQHSERHTTIGLGVQQLRNGRREGGRGREGKRTRHSLGNNLLPVVPSPAPIPAAATAAAAALVSPASRKSSEQTLRIASRGTFDQRMQDSA